MKWLLRLYPRAWRERYEEEMPALLEQHRSACSTCSDLLRGASDAHLDSSSSFDDHDDDVEVVRHRTGREDEDLASVGLVKDRIPRVVGQRGVP